MHKRMMKCWRSTSECISVLLQESSLPFSSCSSIELPSFLVTSSNFGKRRQKLFSQKVSFLWEGEKHSFYLFKIIFTFFFNLGNKLNHSQREGFGAFESCWICFSNAVYIYKYKCRYKYKYKYRFHKYSTTVQKIWSS